MHPKGCPFHSESQGVSLAELPGIVRCGDRVRLRQAMAKFENALSRAQDIDEARSLGLTFVALVTAATLEMGGERTLHRIQLDLARRLDEETDHAEIADQVRAAVETICATLFGATDARNAALMDRAMRFIARHYSDNIDDEMVAREVGLSTSHFRHLFREATGQPFHKYLISMRLEQARALLVDKGMKVSEVAEAVGFAGLPSFSRAFQSRFSVRPSDLRRGATS